MKLIVGFLLFICLNSLINSQNIVLVGGGLKDENADIYNSFFSLASLNGDPNIGIITAASETPEENGKFYENLFKTTYKIKNA